MPGTITDFRRKNDVVDRQNESTRLLAKFPGYVPVIVTRHHRATISDIDKNKYLCPTSLTVSEFLYSVRRRIKLRSCDSFFFLTESGAIPRMSMTMGDLYGEQRDKDDRLLYLVYTSENTFG